MKQNKGFSLIELMIVIAIIGIIAAIIVPIIKDNLNEHKEDLKEIVATGKEIVNVNSSDTNVRRQDNFIKEKCIEGKRVVIIDDVVYYLTIKDSWGDLMPVKCE